MSAILKSKKIAVSHADAEGVSQAYLPNSILGFLKLSF